MSRTCPASWFDDHSAQMTSRQGDIPMGSRAIDRYANSLLHSLYALCAIAHPTEDFTLAAQRK